MGRQTKEKKIGEHTYVVTQFGALVGKNVLFRLTTMIGPAMAGMLKGGLSAAGLCEAITVFSGTAKEADFDWLCGPFASCSKVKQGLTTGASITLDLADQTVFDDHFVGRYDEMIKWIAFAAEVNFGDFLFGKDGALNALVPRAEQKIPSN